MRNRAAKCEIIRGAVFRLCGFVGVRVDNESFESVANTQDCSVFSHDSDHSTGILTSDARYECGHGLMLNGLCQMVGSVQMALTAVCPVVAVWVSAKLYRPVVCC